MKRSGIDIPNFKSINLVHDIQSSKLGALILVTNLLMELGN